MSSAQSLVDYLVDQMSGIGKITSRKMFGEYALYCDSKVIALVCDDQLFIKPTKAGEEFLNTIDLKPPYPGAKPYYRISEDKFDDREWLRKLAHITAAELPLPKRKKQSIYS